MSTANNLFNGPALRDVLYISIFGGVAIILRSSETLHKHEAFLVSGGLAFIAVLLLEPRDDKFGKGLIWLSVVVSFYGLVMKLPIMLMGRLNHYVVYVIAYVLLAIVALGVLVVSLKYGTSSGQ
jgi:hypothetical protein